MGDTDSQKMSVLLVTPQLSFGGAEVHVVNLANGLFYDGYLVTVLSSGGDLESNLEKEISIIYGPVNQKSLWAMLKCGWIIRQLIIKKNIDLIHTHAVTPSISAKLAVLTKPIPIINTAHGWEENEYARVAKFLKRTVDKIIAVSNSVADRLVKGGFPSRLVEVVYNGTDLGDRTKVILEKKELAKKGISLTTDNVVITTVARLEPPKGLFVLLQAASKVIHLFPKAKFLIIGDGTLRTLLEQKADELGLRDFLCFWGWQKDVGRILAASDIFCLPSLREGLPISIAEAMTLEIPVVATNIDGIPEMVLDGITGFLVPPNDPDALADKLMLLLTESYKREQMGRLGRKRAEALFSKVGMVKRVEKVYVSVCNK